MRYSGPISLDEDDIKNLGCLNPDNFSFTHYVPDSQDKPTNQDFALSGHFTGRSDGGARLEIAAIMGRSPSTINRALKQNLDWSGFWVFVVIVLFSLFSGLLLE